MRLKINNILLVVVFLLSSQFILGQKIYSVQDVPNVHLVDENWYVSDPEGILSVADINRLNERLALFEDSANVECAVVVLPAIDYSPSVFAHDLLNEWGIGGADDDRGLVFLLVYGEGDGSKRDIYMASGYGLEDELPDAICKKIQVEYMVPYFSEEKFSEGLISGLDITYQKLLGTYEIEKEQDYIFLKVILYILAQLLFILIATFFQKRYYKKNKIDKIIFLGNRSLIAVYLLFIPIYCMFPINFIYPFVFLKRRREFLKKHVHCEKCNSSNIKISSQVIKAKTKHGKNVRRFTLKCTDCGHEQHKDKTLVPSESSTSTRRSPIRNTNSTSSSSSSNGGSWGGGSSGGGGAGTSF